MRDNRKDNTLKIQRVLKKMGMTIEKRDWLERKSETENLREAEEIRFEALSDKLLELEDQLDKLKREEI